MKTQPVQVQALSDANSSRYENTYEVRLVKIVSNLNQQADSLNRGQLMLVHELGLIEHLSALVEQYTGRFAVNLHAKRQ